MSSQHQTQMPWVKWDDSKPSHGTYWLSHKGENTNSKRCTSCRGPLWRIFDSSIHKMQKWVEKWAHQKIKKKKKPVPPPFSGLRRFTNMDRSLQPELFRGSATVLLKILNNLIELWSQILHLSRVRSSKLQRHSKSKLLDNSMKPWKKLFANSFLLFLVFLYHLHSLYRNANCH